MEQWPLSDFFLFAKLHTFLYFPMDKVRMFSTAHIPTLRFIFSSNSARILRIYVLIVEKCAAEREEEEHGITTSVTKAVVQT